MGSQAQPDSSDPAVFAAGSASAPMSDDELAGIGYEAAYPLLHAPLWCEAMQALPDAYAR